MADGSERPQMSERIVPDGVLVGRAVVPGHAYPRIVTVREGAVYDITWPLAPTVRDICELANPAEYVRDADGVRLGDLDAVLANSWRDETTGHVAALLSPIDLQAVKAAGVTFVVSLLERVIEEQARGDKSKAD